MEIKELLELPKLSPQERAEVLETYDNLCSLASEIELESSDMLAINYIVTFSGFVTSVVDALTRCDTELSKKLLGVELYDALRNILTQANYDDVECKASVTYFVQFGSEDTFNELCEILNIPNRLQECRRYLNIKDTKQFDVLNKLVKSNHLRILPTCCEFTHQQVLEQFQFCKEDGKLLKIFIPKEVIPDLASMHDTELVALIPPAYDEMNTVWYNKSISYWSKVMNIKLREFEHKDSIDMNLYKEIMLEELIPEVKATPCGQGKTLGMLSALRELAGDKDFSLTGVGVVDTTKVSEK